VTALRWLGGAAVGLFAAVAFTPAADVLQRSLVVPPPPAAPAEAIVVLGAGLDGSVLSSESLRRALGGITLFRHGLAPALVMLGPGPAVGPTEAEIRRRLATDMGVPPSAVAADPRGLTTRDEARVCWEALAPRGARRILLVTGSQHMPRAAALFRRAGFDVVVAPVEELPLETPRPQRRLELFRGLVRELVARVYNRAAGYL